MKLSTALRIGSKGRGRCKGQYMDENGNVCLLGAIALGLGCPVYAYSIKDALGKMSWLDIDLVNELQKMNDTKEFTFEEAALWLESGGL